MRDRTFWEGLAKRTGTKVMRIRLRGKRWQLGRNNALAQAALRAGGRMRAT